VNQIKIDDPLCECYTVEQAGKLFGLCRNSAYAAVKNGLIPVIRFGASGVKMRVPKAALHRMLDSATGLKESA
jgi:excisionase family DNA binding protein